MLYLHVESTNSVILGHLCGCKLRPVRPLQLWTCSSLSYSGVNFGAPLLVYLSPLVHADSSVQFQKLF